MYFIYAGRRRQGHHECSNTLQQHFSKQYQFVVKYKKVNLLRAKSIVVVLMEQCKPSSKLHQLCVYGAEWWW